MIIPYALLLRFPFGAKCREKVVVNIPDRFLTSIVVLGQRLQMIAVLEQRYIIYCVEITREALKNSTHGMNRQQVLGNESYK